MVTQQIIQSPKHVGVSFSSSYFSGFSPKINNNVLGKGNSNEKSVGSVYKSLFPISHDRSSHLEFELTDTSNQIVIKVVDTNTGEILRRIPHLESSTVENNVGILVDEIV